MFDSSKFHCINKWFIDNIYSFFRRYAWTTGVPGPKANFEWDLYNFIPTLGVNECELHPNRDSIYLRMTLKYVEDETTRAGSLSHHWRTITN